MGLNEELKEAPQTNEWSFFTWQEHSTRLDHGGMDIYGLERAHIEILRSKSTLPELPNAASLLRDIKALYLQIWAFYTVQRF